MPHPQHKPPKTSNRSAGNSMREPVLIHAQTNNNNKDKDASNNGNASTSIISSPTTHSANIMPSRTAPSHPIHILATNTNSTVNQHAPIRSNVHHHEGSHSNTPPTTSMRQTAATAATTNHAAPSNDQPWNETDFQKRLDAIESIVILQQEQIRKLESKTREQTRIFEAKNRVLELQVQQLQNQLEQQQQQQPSHSHPTHPTPSTSSLNSQNPQQIQHLQMQLCKLTYNSDSSTHPPPPPPPPILVPPMLPNNVINNDHHDTGNVHDTEHHHNHHNEHNHHHDHQPTTGPSNVNVVNSGPPQQHPTPDITHEVVGTGQALEPTQPPRKKTRVKRSMLTNGIMDLKDYPQRKHLPTELHSRVAGGITKKSKNRRSCAYCSLLYMEKKRKDGHKSNVSWDAFVKRTNSECSYCKVVLCRNHFKLFHDLP